MTLVQESSRRGEPRGESQHQWPCIPVRVPGFDCGSESQQRAAQHVIASKGKDAASATSRLLRTSAEKRLWTQSSSITSDANVWAMGTSVLIASKRRDSALTSTAFTAQPLATTSALTSSRKLLTLAMLRWDQSDAVAVASSTLSSGSTLSTMSSCRPSAVKSPTRQCETSMRSPVKATSSGARTETLAFTRMSSLPITCHQSHDASSARLSSTTPARPRTTALRRMYSRRTTQCSSRLRALRHAVPQPSGPPKP
mmetsp:Transcript_18183/g.46559  ORF Transcript_18183/g.46559 Transcript_18183/m.46559 type:complete len:255 (-) Transcript_18183:307-1071(-)